MKIIAKKQIEKNNKKLYVIIEHHIKGNES